MLRLPVITTIAAGALSLSLPSKAHAQAESAPMEKSGRAIHGVSVGAPKTIPNNIGDTWVAAWGDDDTLYTPSNDTFGFHGRDPRLPWTPEQNEQFNRDPSSVHFTAAQKKWWQDACTTIALNRLIGDDPLALDGVTVNWMRDFRAQDLAREELPGVWLGTDGRTWKSSGCAFIDGTLYWVIARHNYGDASGNTNIRQTAADASIIKSSDFGKSWTRSPKENMEEPMFPGSNFATPYFIDYGKSGLQPDGADRYVYALSNNGFWDNGDTMILGRVARSRIGRLNGSDWEFFTGGDGSLDANWTHDAGHAKAVVESPRKLGETGAVYLPAQRRYLMIGWYYPDGSGHFKGISKKTVWDFYEASRPWGPWTRIASHTWSPEGYYCPEVCPKFQSADRIYVFTAGDFNSEAFYHLTVVPVDLH